MEVPAAKSFSRAQWFNDHSRHASHRQRSPLASQRQLNYIHHLAHGLAGLTPRRLEILSATVCGKRLAHLTSADASNLIDTLKQIQAGEKDLSGVPQEASA